MSNDELLLRMADRYAHIAPELWAEDPGVFRVKQAGGVHVDVLPLMFTAAIVTTPVGQTLTYNDRWCYETIEAALSAAAAWSGEPGTEPDGWHRHPATGRRRHNGIEEIAP